MRYGGTAGIITIEDIVEEIVGEIEDEFDPDNKYLTRLAPRVARRWAFSCDDAIELGWPFEESDDYETIAGWILELCDSVPDIGEVFEVAGSSLRCSRCVASASRSFARSLRPKPIRRIPSLR